MFIVASRMKPWGAFGAPGASGACSLSQLPVENAVETDMPLVLPRQPQLASSLLFWVALFLVSLFLWAGTLLGGGLKNLFKAMIYAKCSIAAVVGAL